MRKVTLFAAAAAVSALIATPVLAQDYAKPRAGKQMKTSQMKQHQASKKQMKQHARARQMTGDRVAYQDRGWDNRSGFWPGAVVAGAVGTAGAVAATAVGTAGAVATAPFGGPYYRDSYAYGPGYVDAYSYNGVVMPYSPNYAARNGFVCEPGTFIKGTRTLCQ